MFSRLLKFSLLMSLLALFSTALAQDNRQLQQLRQEIRRLEGELKSTRDREKSILEQVEDVERELGLQAKLIKALQVERGLRESRIRETENQLRETSKGFDRRKALVANRMVSMYKRGRMAAWEVILSMKSLNQVLV
ncbi:hypothetical protein BVY01_00975, partial [bacterium I07]